MAIEFLWFQECPNHQAARELLREVLQSKGMPDDFEDVDTTDAAVAERLRSPGSPTIRVDGRDIEPGYVDQGDYSPRCRVYLTEEGMRGLPKREWIETALGSESD